MAKSKYDAYAGNATTTGYLVAVRMQARGQWQRRQPWPTPRRFV